MVSRSFQPSSSSPVQAMPMLMPMPTPSQSQATRIQTSNVTHAPARSGFAVSEGPTRMVLIYTYNAHTHTLTVEKWQLMFFGTDIPATWTEVVHEHAGAAANATAGATGYGVPAAFHSGRCSLSQGSWGPLCVHFHALMDRAPVAQWGREGFGA
ncbi:hypothetical protein BDV10DRAFT_183263 [Aspergillus recurvatus]